MKSRIWVSLSVASLTLAVTASAMWVRSHDTEDEHRHVARVAGQNAYIFLMSSSGQLAVKVVPAWPIEPPGEPDWKWSREHEEYGRLFSDSGSRYGAAGIGVETGDDVIFDYLGTSTMCRGVAVMLPHGLVVMAFAVLPAKSLFRYVRRRRRQARSLCVGCGYDLRASSDRCPECGRVCALAAAPVSSDPRQRTRAESASPLFRGGDQSCRDIL